MIIVDLEVSILQHLIKSKNPKTQKPRLEFT